MLKDKIRTDLPQIAATVKAMKQPDLTNDGGYRLFNITWHFGSEYGERDLVVIDHIAFASPIVFLAD